MMSWIVGPAVAPPRGLPLIGVRLSRRLAVAGTVILLLAVVACLLTGLSPLLPIFLALLALLAVSPVVGLGYALVVLNTPLGLWFLGAEGWSATLSVGGTMPSGSPPRWWCACCSR